MSASEQHFRRETAAASDCAARPVAIVPPMLADLAARLDLPLDALIPYGRDIAKLEAAARPPRGRVILVSAMTPTARGEGKTTVSIGLGDGLSKIGERVVVALRQPSLGPLFGIKGGGSGGGRAQLVPGERIDVHFTGDLHAIAAAHNLLAAAVDNHLHFATDLGLDPRAITWRRSVDMNDRALRKITVSLGEPAERETGFIATAASEITAILGLAGNAAELRARIDRIIVGANRDGAPVTAAQIGVTGAMARLLAEAVLPNLVRTAEGTPAFVHGGPFANIAHGCSSVIATRAALGLADWVITEAGFGFDLGGEKFFDIKCRTAGLDAAAVVLVATVASLRAHGQGDLAAGLANAAAHIEAVKRFGKSPVIAINAHPDDAPGSHAAIAGLGEAHGVPVVVTECYARGGDGATELARAVVAAARRDQPLRHPYQLADAPRAKLYALATAIYGAREVVWTPEADAQLAALPLGAATWPVCVAKTPLSLSDDPARLGRPSEFPITVRGVRASAGAGFWVALCGAVNLMPGLPRRPRANDM
jgi:formate--tetrahydrofolate ligase